MKAIVKLHKIHTTDNSGTVRALANEAIATVDRWKEEHEDYYAHRLTPVYNRITIGPEIPRWWSSHPYAAGYHALEKGGRWMTSKGNYAAVIETEDSVIIFLDGRRHGVRQPVDLAGYTYKEHTIFDSEGMRAGEIVAYESQCPESAPWEFDLTPAEA